MGNIHSGQAISETVGHDRGDDQPRMLMHACKVQMGQGLDLGGRGCHGRKVAVIPDAKTGNAVQRKLVIE